MGYHTENVYYAVVINDQVQAYLAWRQINMQQTRVQKYVFISTNIYHVVLFVVNSLKKNAQYVLCVPLILVMWLLVNYAHVKSLCYLGPLYHNLMSNTTLQIYITWNFIWHMCVFWGHNTVSKSTTRPLTKEENIMTSYDGVVFLKWLYPVLHNKSNLNTTVAICLYPLKALH